MSFSTLITQPMLRYIEVDSVSAANLSGKFVGLMLIASIIRL